MLGEIEVVRMNNSDKCISELLSDYNLKEANKIVRELFDKRSAKFSNFYSDKIRDLLYKELGALVKCGVDYALDVYSKGIKHSYDCTVLNILKLLGAKLIIDCGQVEGIINHHIKSHNSRFDKVLKSEVLINSVYRESILLSTSLALHIIIDLYKCSKDDSDLQRLYIMYNSLVDNYKNGGVYFD